MTKVAMEKKIHERVKRVEVSTRLGSAKRFTFDKKKFIRLARAVKKIVADETAAKSR